MKRLFFFISILTSFILSVFPASADEAGITVSAQYDVSTGELGISGKYTMGAGRIVNIFVVPAQDSLESFSYDDIDITKNAIFAAEAGENGDFALNVMLPDSFETNEYRLYAVSSDMKASTEFVYLNAGIADKILATAAGKSYEEFLQIISTNLKALGIDSDSYHENSEYINKTFYNFMPESGYKSADFIERYYKALAMSKYASGSVTLNELVKQSADVLGIDTDKFNQLTETEKGVMETILKEIDFTENEISEKINENLILARLMGADGYENLKTVMLKYSSDLSMDMSDYNKLNNDYYRNNVFKSVYEKNCTTEEEFVNAFKQAAAAQLAAQNKANTSSGSGSVSSGGGGGGSIGSSAAALSAAVTAPVVSDTETDVLKFDDINGHWAEEEIYSLAQKGIVAGHDGMFRPNDTITRAEFTKMAVLIFNIEQKPGSVFDDVSQDAWFAGYVGGAAESGLINGTGTEFMPNAEITREDICVILTRGLNNKNVQLYGEYHFADDADISDYAKEAVNAMAKNGIVNGDGTDFRPKAQATRAEAAKIIYNVLKLI